MGILVEASQAARLQLANLHDAWDERDQAHPAQSPTADNNQPARPQARALVKPNRGSRDHPQLLARASAGNHGAATNLDAPATRVPTTAARALAPAIGIPMSGMNALAASFSEAMAKGVNPVMSASLESATATDHAALAGARPDANVLNIYARAAVRQRGRLERYMLPMLTAA